MAFLSDSDLRAGEAADDLRRRIEQEVELDSELSQRLESLQLPPDVIELEHLGDRNMESAKSCQRLRESDSRPARTINMASPIQEAISDDLECGNLEPSHKALTVEESFDLVLASTRVYSRVDDREVDAVSSVSTTRSRAWSILSGLSLTEISVISVIKLPLYEPELIRFCRLASPLSPSNSSSSNFSSGNSGITHALKRLRKELVGINRDPPSPCCGGPVGDDMVHAKYSLVFAGSS